MNKQIIYVKRENSLNDINEKITFNLNILILNLKEKTLQLDENESKWLQELQSKYKNAEILNPRKWERLYSVNLIYVFSNLNASYKYDE